MSALYLNWYKDSPQTHFHFFNDNTEWQQVDKFGHLTTAYQLTNIGYETWKWGERSEQKSLLYGIVYGFVYQNTIEVLDGFSSKWGFSLGDFAANSLGIAFFVGQQYLWKEQRLKLKFFYAPSVYSVYNPNLLGSSLQERILKDYNAQTYWLSINIASFLATDSNFPRWLNIALGYGAKGMVGAEYNSTQINGIEIPLLERYRQFYFSLDFDLSKIKTKNKNLRLLYNTIGILKIPFPSIGYNEKDKFKLYYLNL